jgi:hypothetical protein
MLVVKPLYRLAKAGTHWWVTYHNHHLSQLQMMTSTYDPCLLLIRPANDDFACIGMQTDDTLGTLSVQCSDRSEEELRKAKFNTKVQTIYAVTELLAFNGGILTLNNDGLITLR